jgi:hypothetical protein
MSLRWLTIAPGIGLSGAAAAQIDGAAYLSPGRANGSGGDQAKAAMRRNVTSRYEIFVGQGDKS